MVTICQISSCCTSVFFNATVFTVFTLLALFHEGNIVTMSETLPLPLL